MKCKDCRFHAIDYMTSYSHTGVFEFHYCAFIFTLPRLVDADIERECPNFVANIAIEAKSG